MEQAVSATGCSTRKPRAAGTRRHQRWPDRLAATLRAALCRQAENALLLLCGQPDASHEQAEIASLLDLGRCRRILLISPDATGLQLQLQHSAGLSGKNVVFMKLEQLPAEAPLPFAAGSFDAVLLHHLPPGQTAAGTLQRVLPLLASRGVLAWSNRQLGGQLRPGLLRLVLPWLDRGWLHRPPAMPQALGDLRWHATRRGLAYVMVASRRT